MQQKKLSTTNIAGNTLKMEIMPQCCLFEIYCCVISGATDMDRRFPHWLDFRNQGQPSTLLPSAL